MRVLNFYTVGQKIPTNAVYVGRPNRAKGLPDTGHGNPFAMRSETDRPRVIAQHKQWLNQRLVDEPHLAQTLVDQLHGHDLVCFCAPKACHADTLRETVQRLYAEGLRPAK